MIFFIEPLSRFDGATLLVENSLIKDSRLLETGFKSWKEHDMSLSIFIMAPELSNSPQ